MELVVVGGPAKFDPLNGFLHDAKSLEALITLDDLGLRIPSLLLHNIGQEGRNPEYQGPRQEG